MTCAHRQQLLFLAALLLAAAAGPHSAQGRDIGDTAGDWIDWIKGKITGDDGGNVPVPPPTGPPSKEDGLQCSTKGGAETCTITAGRSSPDASALHRLLRYPTAQQLAARKEAPLHILIRDGAYTSIPLTIPNNTHITIEEGAALVFDAEDAGIYNLWVAEPLPTYGAGQDAGGPLRYRAHLDCDVCRNVTIDGKGVIDGGGERWWAAWEAKRSGDATAAEFLSKDRPALLEFRGCANVALQGLTLRNSPWWSLHPFNCSGFSVEGVTIDSPFGRPGAHALVLDSSRDVSISDTRISTGGDCVALQSGVDAPGQRWNLPTQGISLVSLTCAAPTGAALRLGPQLAGGISNVEADVVTVHTTRDAVLLETAWGCGGYVRDVLLFSWMLDAGTGTMLRIDGHSSGCESGWAKTHTRNITLEDIHLGGSKASHIRVQGGVPLVLSGFHVYNAAVLSGAACWSAVWVGGVCRAKPGFVMFMWFLALLAAAAAVAGLAMAAGVRLRRRLHAALEARRRVAEDLADEEDTLDLETIELINLEHRRAAQLQDSLEEPALYVHGQARGLAAPVPATPPWAHQNGGAHMR